MRTAAAIKLCTATAARSLPLLPPVGGLNATDSISDMPPTDALLLDNFFPQPDFVELRRGYESQATGLTSAVESILHWSGPTSQKIFRAAGANIFDVTSVGAVGSAAVSGLGSARWQQVMQATAGGNFLIICNGVDSVRGFDGSSWTTPSITGISSAMLDNLWLFKERVFFVEENSLSAWYLGTKAITGAATELPLGSVFKKGGKLVIGGSMTRDSGGGPDDFCVFITNRGECAIYQGTDPAEASTLVLIGVFNIPAPIGRRCLQKAGGDLAVITEGGVISLNAMLVLDRAARCSTNRLAAAQRLNRR